MFEADNNKNTCLRLPGYPLDRVYTRWSAVRLVGGNAMETIVPVVVGPGAAESGVAAGGAAGGAAEAAVAAEAIVVGPGKSTAEECVGAKMAKAAAAAAAKNGIAMIFAAVVG